MIPTRHLLIACGLFIALGLLSPGVARAANDFSAAEQALFLDNHLGTLKPPLSLHYRYRKSGTLEEPFDDKVDVMLKARDDGSCCAASAKFLTGARAMQQPDVDGAEGNPAVLYFLERDIHEMQRLTKGKANYFRKRIRMAVYQAASIRELTLPYRGALVPVREISIAPYLDDPNRTRYEKLANKRYLFLLSQAVPGGLYAIRTRIDGAAGATAPLLAEEMLLVGADTAPLRRQP